MTNYNAFEKFWKHFKNLEYRTSITMRTTKALRKHSEVEESEESSSSSDLSQDPSGAEDEGDIQ